MADHHHKGHSSWCSSSSMGMGTMLMVGTCLFSISLIVPSQLQLARVSVWTLATWLGLSITQAFLAWVSVAVAIGGVTSSRKINSFLHDASLHVVQLTLMGLYVGYATLVLVRISVIYTKVDGNYRVNVLETTSSSQAPITNFEVDLREALSLQGHTFAVAFGSILSSLALLLSPLTYVAQTLTDISLQSTTHSKKKKHKKQEESESE